MEIATKPLSKREARSRKYFFHYLEQYREFTAKHGEPPSWTNTQDDPRLGDWVARMRLQYKKRTLSPLFITFLEREGFIWDRYQDLWEERFAELEAYSKKHGTTNIPQNRPKLALLYNWVGRQRALKLRGELPIEREKRLLALGVELTVLLSHWDKMLGELKAYRQAHGRLPRWKEPGNQTLSNWIKTQRKKFLRGALPPEQAKKLEHQGIRWHLHSDSWEQRIEEAAAYLRKVGGAANTTWEPKTWRIIGWLRYQSIKHKNNTLPQERAQDLLRIGWPLTTPNKKQIRKMAQPNQLGAPL